MKDKLEYELEEFSKDDEIFYDYIMSKKKDLEQLKESELIPINKIQGCMSIVYIKIDTDKKGTILYGYSDSIIISGILGIIGLAIRNDLNPKIENYKKIISIIKNSLSQNRRLGFENMLRIVFKES